MQQCLLICVLASASLIATSIAIPYKAAFGQAVEVVETSAIPVTEPVTEPIAPSIEEIIPAPIQDDPHIDKPEIEEAVEDVPQTPVPLFNPKKYEYRRSLIFTQLPPLSLVPPKQIRFEIPAAVYQSIGTKQAVAMFDRAESQPQPLNYEFGNTTPEVRPLTPEDVYRTSAGGISYIFPLQQFRGSATYRKGLVPVGSDAEIFADVSHFSGTVSMAYTTLYQGREFTYWQPLASGLPLWINKDYFGVNRTIKQYDLQKLFTDPKIKRDEEAIPYIRITVFPDEQYKEVMGELHFAARTHAATQDQPAKATLIQSEESDKVSSERVYVFDTGEAGFRHHGLRLTIRDSIYAGTISIESSNELGNWIFRGRDILASSPNQNTEFEKYFTTYKPTTDRYIRLTIKSLKGSVRPTEFAELITDPIYAYIDLPSEISKNLTGTEPDEFAPQTFSQPQISLNADIYYAPDASYKSKGIPAAEIILNEGSIMANAFVGPEERNPAYISIQSLTSINDQSIIIDSLDHTAAVIEAGKNIGIHAWRYYRETIILGIISLLIILIIGAVVRPRKQA